MKVLLNQISQFNTNSILKVERKKEKGTRNNLIQNSYSLPSVNYANFSNISFGMSPEMSFLMRYAERLRCAYSGRKMLHPHKLNGIYEKLQKKPNAQSATNFLDQYQEYMLDIEARIFDLFKNTKNMGKKTFQDILLEHKPEALLRLQNKQIEVIKSADSIIEKMDSELAEKVRTIRDTALSKITLETEIFGRKEPLDALAELGNLSENSELREVYKQWYKLPSSSTDMDAFIVNMSRESHSQISKRLISTSVATIEHVIPTSRGGVDSLEDFVLVCAGYNNSRSSLPLNDFIEYNPKLDVPRNLQNYLNELIGLVKDSKSTFYDKTFYPKSIKETIGKETEGKIVLDLEKLSTQPAKNNKVRDRKTNQRYTPHHK